MTFSLMTLFYSLIFNAFACSSSFLSSFDLHGFLVGVGDEDFEELVSELVLFPVVEVESILEIVSVEFLSLLVLVSRLVNEYAISLRLF